MIINDVTYSNKGKSRVNTCIHSQLHYSIGCTYESIMERKKELVDDINDSIQLLQIDHYP